MITEKNTPAPTAVPKASVPSISRLTPSAGALTRQQRDALFDQAANGIAPAHPKKKPEDPLRRWTPQILRKHKEGYSAAQIATMAGAPGIGLKVSARAIKRLLNEHAKRKTPPASGSNPS
jgi:hypothetical protein